MGLFNFFQKKRKASVSKTESKTSLINEAADALRQNDNKKIKSLIEQIDNINEKDIYGNPLLNIAAENGNIEAVQVLLNAGADTESTDNHWGRTALIWAEKNEHKEIVELLKNANGKNLYSDSISGGEYILACAKSGNRKEVKKLIESGANIEQRDSSDNTPLIVATYSGHTDIVKLLINAGANIDAQGEGSYTALILAVIYGNTEMVRMLLDAGADKSITIPGGATAFSKAQDENDEEIISMLNEIQNPTDLNSRSSVNGVEANSDKFTDSRDGKEYKTVKIGKQIWFAENLAFKLKTGCWHYKNGVENYHKYGCLYDWDTAIKVAPDGWRLPSKKDWEELITFIKNEGYSESSLKANTGWDFSNDYNRDGNGDDNFGFCALPGGSYSLNSQDFYDIGLYGDWWSSTQSDEDSAWILNLYSGLNEDELCERTKGNGFAIRCLKN
jgi:uncharacterized protein (TIGR02145 family)